MWQPRPVGGHAVLALDRTNRDRVLVSAFVAHDADALNRQQHRETLPQTRVPLLPFDFLRDDVVGAPQQIEAFGRDLTENSHGQPGTRKRLAHDELLVESQLASDLAYFVLEQLAQGLDEL